MQFSVGLPLFPMNSGQNELLVVSRSAQLGVSVQMKCSPIIVVRTSPSGAGSLRSLMPGRHPQHAALILMVQHDRACRSLLPDLPLADIPGRLYRLVAENGQPATPTRSTRTLDEVRAMNNAKKLELPLTFALCAHPGRIGGRPLSACTRPNSPDIHPGTASALALIERGGCWAGTRDSGEKIGKHRRFRDSRSAHSDFSFTKWLGHWSTGSTSSRRVLHQAARHRQLP